MGAIIAKLFRKFPGLMSILVNTSWLHRWANDRLINNFANSAPPRPRPFSLLANYTSWRSLTDRTYTGRHLPEADPTKLPALEDVVELWRRGQDKEILSTDTSMLFSFFAQWFTDSFLRTNLHNRALNHSNHEIDFCQLYGMSKTQTDLLRSKTKGQLRHQIIEGEMYLPALFDPETPENPDDWVFANGFEKLHDLKTLKFIFQRTPLPRLRKMFATGLEHGNSNIGYTLLNTIALREHNRICCLLASTHKDWNDERLFETARNIMIVLLLKIVAGDYVRHISSVDFPFTVQPGMAERQPWYRSNWITMEFNLLYRWHSMVPDILRVGSNHYAPDDYRNNPELLIQHGVEKFVTAASSQLAGRIGLKNTAEMFFKPMPIRRQDGTIDTRSVQERTVAMGRDFKLRSFNEYREEFGHTRVKSFEDLTDDKALCAELKSLYQDDIDAVEWHVGIFAEKHEPDAMLGELMTTMVAYDAFTHVLTNPLLSEHVYGEATFSKEGLKIIDETNTIYDFVARNVSNPTQLSATFTV